MIPPRSDFRSKSANVSSPRMAMSMNVHVNLEHRRWLKHHCQPRSALQSSGAE